MATECFQKVHVSSNQTVTNGISPVWRNCKTRRSWKFICSTLFLMIELEHGLLMGLMFESLPSRNQTYIQPKSQISHSLSKRNIYKEGIWLYDYLKRISQKPLCFVWVVSLTNLPVWSQGAKERKLWRFLLREQNSKLPVPLGYPADPAVIFHDTNSFSETWLFGTLEV